MQLTIGVLSLLIFWFAWGIFLVESTSLRDGFNFMNSVLALEWFSHPQRLPFLVKFWFIGLCNVMAVLGVNLIFCSWTRFLRLVRDRHATSRMVMLIIHTVFGLVALGHFGSFFLGYRFENVHVAEGQTFELPEGYAITVKAIHGGVNPVMYASGGKHAPVAFDPKMNFCEVALTRNGIQVAEGSAFFLRPFVYQDIQITLKRFTPPREYTRGNMRGSKPGVRLIVSRNPVKLLVFVLFPVMLAGIGIYLAMTWRTRPADE